MAASEHDRYRPLTAAAVLLVTGIAATVSYMHVRDLALAYGQPPLAAYLLPLSIDGMVATSSLVLLRSARAGISSPWLARFGLALAVAATLVANIASGLPNGWPAAVLAGWPALGFVVCAETAIALSRRKAAKRTPDTATIPATGTVEPAVTRPSQAGCRTLVFDHYGRVCACCGATSDLQIDHVNGDGLQHRWQLGSDSSKVLYRWLVDNGLPEGFQTLCGTCNRSKRAGVRCNLHDRSPSSQGDETETVVAAVRRLRDQDPALTQKQIADRLGISARTIRRKLSAPAATSNGQGGSHGSA